MKIKTRTTNFETNSKHIDLYHLWFYIIHFELPIDQTRTECQKACHTLVLCIFYPFWYLI